MSTTQQAQVSPRRWSLIGPGIIVAATGVGAADLVTTLIAGTKYHYGLVWCVIAGCLLKIVLVEGAGRYTLATGHTIYEGWSSLGRWTHVYFVPYIIIWGFVYGAAAMAGTGLALASLFPVLSITWWGIVAALVGTALVWLGRYEVFEKVTAALVGLMFVTMVGAAIMTVPNILDVLAGLKPWIPDGGLVNVLALGGGVGGTITVAAYGYWLREKGWDTPGHMKVMRLDNTVAYTITGIFVLATLIVGAELLYSSQVAINEGDRGLIDVADVLGDRYGVWAGKVFLVGFFAAAFSSLLGVWNGVSLMFADLVGHLRGLPEDDPQRRAGGIWYRAYILWLTFPPMIMLFLGEPVWLILAYGVLGAVFLPFMSVTMLWILNTSRVPEQWRNRWYSNLAMVLCALAFLALAATNVDNALGAIM